MENKELKKYITVTEVDKESKHAGLALGISTEREEVLDELSKQAFESEDNSNIIAAIADVSSKCETVNEVVYVTLLIGLNQFSSQRKNPIDEILEMLGDHDDSKDIN